MIRAAAAMFVLLVCFAPASAAAQETSGLSENESRTSRLAAHDYMLNCMGCHQQDGNGVEGKVPSLAGMPRRLATRAGREYLARVPGVAQVGLSDARVAALLNWTITRFGEAPAVPYTSEEIAPLRKRPLRRLADSGLDVR